MASEAEQKEESMPDAQQVQPEAAQSAAERRSKRKKKRWGEETDLGKQILEGADIEQLQVPAAEPPAVEQQQEHQAAEDEAPKAKKRRSRWEPESDSKPAAATAAATTTLPGGLQIALPPSIAALVDVNLDSNVMELQRQLNVVNQKLQLLGQGKFVEDSPEGGRSPSPEPVYNESGARVNTREARAKEKILRKRNEIITELIKANPNYKPPADYRPEKKYRKLRIPIDDYPGYNFIGLIIGPRGNTQKRMERETNCKIAIRGRGSIKEGRSRKDSKPDSSENEELHVLITAENDHDADMAYDMVSKLLTPMDDSTNEHKQLQLRELAAINGTLRDHELIEQQRQLEGSGGPDEPYRLPEHLREAVERQYRKDVERVHGEEAGRLDDEYKSFIQELGGEQPMAGPPEPHPRDRRGLGHHHHDRRDAGPPGSDPCHLYVGYIASHVTDQMLDGLFRSCGAVLECQIVRDKFTGESKGFGFVRMATEEGANAALQRLDNYLIGNKRLAVRIKGRHGPNDRGRSGGVVGAPMPWADSGHFIGPDGPLPPPPCPDSLLLPGPPPGMYPPPPALPGEAATAAGEAAAAAAGAAPGQHGDAGLDSAAAAAAAAGEEEKEEPPPGLEDDDAEPGSSSPAAAAAVEGPSAAAHPAAAYGGYYDPYYGYIPGPQDPGVAAAAAAASDYAAANGWDSAAAAAAAEPGLPDEEPPPPGEEDDQSAAAAAAADGSSYPGYDASGYPSSYDAYGQYYGMDPYASGHFDPAAYMSEADYEAYLQDSDTTAAAAATASEVAAADGDQGDKGSDKKEPKKPSVVQVVSLDPQELERARARREEEERRTKQHKEQERLQKMLADRQQALAKAKQHQQHEQQQQEFGTLPPPPPPPATRGRSRSRSRTPPWGADRADRAERAVQRGFRADRGFSPGRDRGFSPSPGRRGYSPPARGGYMSRGRGPRRGVYQSPDRSWSRSRSPAPYGRRFSRSRNFSRSRSRSRSRSLQPPPAAATAAAAAEQKEPERESSPEEGEIEEGEVANLAEAPAAPAAAAGPGRPGDRPVRRNRIRGVSREPEGRGRGPEGRTFSRSRSRSRSPGRGGPFRGRSRSPGYRSDRRVGPYRGGGDRNYHAGRGAQPPPPRGRGSQGFHDADGHYDDHLGPGRGWGGRGRGGRGRRGRGGQYGADYAGDYDHFSGRSLAGQYTAAAAAMQMAALANMAMGGMVVYGWPGMAGAAGEGEEEYYEEGGAEEAEQQ